MVYIDTIGEVATGSAMNIHHLREETLDQISMEQGLKITGMIMDNRKR